MAQPPQHQHSGGAGCTECEHERELDAELPRPSPADVERWKASAADVPGPLGRTLRVLLAEVERLGGEGERQRRLLRRVRCYAVVDPLGNPAAICLPHAARMLGIERDIDDALEGRPELDAERPHGPVCTSLDAGCPDCLRLQAARSAPR